MSVSASNQAGMKDLRASTRAFIEDDPTYISLLPARGTRVEKPSGGYDYGVAASRPVQMFKIIQQAGDSTAKGDSESGITTVNRGCILLGEWDSIAEVGDVWTDGANRYVVQELLAENGYERRWLVTAQGPEPNYG